MGAMRGADLIAEYLIAEKVPYVFGLCGHGIVGLMDALGSRADRIKMVGVHHEQVAGYMADAYYRIAHRPVATFTSCGPGSVNLVIALACAMMDSSALVAITGNVPTTQFNRGPFQETYRHQQADFPSVVRPHVNGASGAAPEMLPLACASVQDGRHRPAGLSIRRPARRLRRGNHGPTAGAGRVVARDRPPLRPVARNRAPGM
jgi:acetolactate synthase-1/2/3 large subunit